MAEHTSGPWVAYFGTSGHSAVIGARALPGRRAILAYIGTGGSTPQRFDTANARLIAASPQLLDSLLAVEFAGTGFTDDADDFDCCPNCQAPLGGHHYVGCELRDALDAALGLVSQRVERIR